MNLDHRRADAGGRFDLLRIGRYEQRDPYPGAIELSDHRRQQIVLPRHVEAAFGGAFGAFFRHQAGRMRPRRKRDAQHFLGCRHFEIERLGDLGLEAGDVVIGDVAAILAQVRGDAVGAGRDRGLGRANGIRQTPAARVPDRGDVIHVHAETDRIDRCAH